MAVKNQIGGRKEGRCHEACDIPGKIRKNLSRQYFLPQIFVGGNVLHGKGIHHLVIVVDPRDHIPGQLPLQTQHIRFDFIAVKI